MTTPKFSQEIDYSRWSRRELEQEQRELLGRAREMLTAAEKTGRGFTPEEEREYRDVEKALEAVDVALKEVEKRRPPPGYAGFRDQYGGDLPILGREAYRPRTRWIDRSTGKELRTIGPRDSMLDAVQGLKPEDRSLSVGRAILGLATGDWTAAEREQRATLHGGQAAAGGYLLSEPLSAMVIDLARSRSVVSRLGATIVPMTQPTLDLARVLGDPTAYWYTDQVRAGGLTEDDTTSFGRLQMNCRTLAGIVRIAVELAEDTNVAELIENQLSAALGLELDRATLYGEGGRLGLRDTADVNEIDMGAAAGAAIADYSPFVNAIRDIFTANYMGEASGLGMAQAPRTWAEIENLVSAVDAQPLMPPQSYKDLQKLVSTQIKVDETHGSASNAASVFVGFWPELLIGMRTNITIEATRTGGDAFTRLHILVRAYLRADWAFARPPFFTRIIGTIPS